MAFNEESSDIYRLDKSVSSSDDAIMTALAREIYDTIMLSPDVSYEFDTWVMADNFGEYVLQFSYDMYTTTYEDSIPITVGAVISIQPFIDIILTFIRDYSPA